VEEEEEEEEKDPLTVLPREGPSTPRLVKSIGIVRALEEWLMALVVPNFEKHFPVLSSQSRNRKALTALKSLKECKTALEVIQMCMVMVGHLFIYMFSAHDLC
jgi:hypothetical protein